MTKTAKFDFQKECKAMLGLLGAEPGGRYDSTLQTVAGVLHCSVHDNWLACSFDDVKLAKKLIGEGNLNPHSGKWNWMYTKPGADDLIKLYATLARIIDLSQNSLTLLQGYEAQAQSKPDLETINTRLSYMYRDADNYKTGASVIFSGGSRNCDHLKQLILAFDRSGDNPCMIPGQIGLLDLQDSFEGCESYWDPESDHPWHEVTAIEPVSASMWPPTDSRTILEFSAQVRAVALGSGWNEDYKPPFYAEMTSRHVKKNKSIPR